MTLQTHDEIKRVAHAIISEYVRAYPAMPHTEVLGDFVDRLELSVHKLRNAEMREQGQALQHEEPQQAGVQDNDHLGGNAATRDPNAPTEPPAAE
jgi:hypothetical protein